MVGESPQRRGQTDQLRRVVPAFAVAVAVVAAAADPASALDFVLVAIPVVAFGLWSWQPKLPLVVISVAAIVPAVVIQRTGHHEPLMFEVSLLAFVVGRWEQPRLLAIALGLLALAAPAAVAVTEHPGNINVGIWMLGIAFPWLIARAVLGQAQLSAQLEAARRELEERAMLEERRRIARDVHDFVGHGLAAVMLQVTGARHVLHRDPAAAEEALRSAEDLGRRSMQELRRTVALLRSDEQPGVLPPVPAADEIPRLINEARTAGSHVELKVQGELSQLPPAVGLAVYRIVQEALANAARHAPEAQTILTLEIADRHVSLLAQTLGTVLQAAGGERERRRYGLIGMRERATALGGELDAGPIPNGWRVSARMPLMPEAQAPQAWEPT